MLLVAECYREYMGLREQAANPTLNDGQNVEPSAMDDVPIEDNDDV